MAERSIPSEVLARVQTAQQNEITEYHIYSRLARTVKDKENGRILQEIADDELRHYHFWQRQTGKEVKPNRWKVFIFFWIARLLGLTFGIKLLERGEEQAQDAYTEIARYIPEAEQIIAEEDAHEHKLIGLINEERLNYVGSMVLGLNDALVELTGTLAGLTFALQNTQVIALAGLITGIAASMSMAASEYLSTKAEGQGETALNAALYTGIAYIFTVAFLVMPYFLFPDYLVCLMATLVIAIVIIFIFNYYISVAKDYSFRQRFTEMALLSLGVAAISFGIGYVIRATLGIEV